MSLYYRWNYDILIIYYHLSQQDNLRIPYSILPVLLHMIKGVLESPFHIGDTLRAYSVEWLLPVVA